MGTINISLAFNNPIPVRWFGIFLFLDYNFLAIVFYYTKNLGHEQSALDHESAYGLQQNNLLMEDVLKAKEQNAPTAKMDTPEAVIDEPKAKAKKAIKTPARYEETGFAINVQNLRLVKERIIGYGASYVQGSPLYTVANMEAVYDEATASLAAMATTKQTYDAAIDQQSVVFGDLKEKATRTKNFFIWCGVSKQAIKRMENLNHLIQGTRVVAISTDDGENHISASHQSRSQQIQHVDALVELLSETIQYIPPADLSAQAWTIKRNQMDSVYHAENTASSMLNAARMKRNADIYKPTNGVVEIGMGAKRVVLAIYGYNSPEYQAIKGIKFRRIKGWKNL